MKYALYFENVHQQAQGDVKVEAEYDADGVNLRYSGVVETVTKAHAKLREFRADFRKALKEPAH